MNKLAREKYKLSWEIGTIHKTSDRWSRFRDEEGNVFFLPFELTDKSRRMYSPFTRKLSPRDGLFHLKAPPILEDAFGVNASAEKMVIFEDASGRSFALPRADVGSDMFVWSPWDKSRSKRVRMVTVPLSGKIEEVFDL